MAKRNVLLLLLCSAPLLASAQKVQEDVVDEAFLDTIFAEDSLAEVVVTGTRTPKFLKETPIQTRVISARDIARQDATNVQDLLQQELPGGVLLRHEPADAPQLLWVWWTGGVVLD